MNKLELQNWMLASGSSTLSLDWPTDFCSNSHLLRYFLPPTCKRRSDSILITKILAITAFHALH